MHLNEQFRTLAYTGLITFLMSCGAAESPPNNEKKQNVPNIIRPETSTNNGNLIQPIKFGEKQSYSSNDLTHGRLPTGLYRATTQDGNSCTVLYVRGGSLASHCDTNHQDQNFESFELLFNLTSEPIEPGTNDIKFPDGTGWRFFSPNRTNKRVHVYGLTPH